MTPSTLFVGSAYFVIVAGSFPRSAWNRGRHATPRLAGLLLASLIGLPLPLLASTTSSIPKPIPVARIKRGTPVDFDREILPILKSNCLACHNRTAAKAKLSLETPEEILRGGDSGPAAIARQGAKSLVVRAAAHEIEETVMPPAGNNVQAADLTPLELGLLKLWIDQGAKPSAATPREIAWQPLPEGLNPIYAAAISPDGRLAAAARANQIFLYDLTTRRLLTRLTDDSLNSSGTNARPGTAHRSIVSSLSFDPEGVWLASGSHREVKLWRRSDPPAVYTVGPIGRSRVETAVVSPDGKWLAVAGDNRPVRLLDAASGKPLRRLRLVGSPKDVTLLAPSPDSRELAAVLRDGTLRIWNVHTGELLAAMPSDASPRSLAWLTGGERLAVGDASFRIRMLHLDRVRRELTLLRELRGHEGPVIAVAALPDDASRLYSASTDGTIRLWNLGDGQSSRQLQHGDAIVAFAISPDGKRFASAGLDGLVRLWDAAEAKVIATSPGDPLLAFHAARAGRVANFLAADLTFHTNTLKTAESDQTAAAERARKAAASLDSATQSRDEKQKAADEAEKSVQSATAARDAATRQLADAAQKEKEAVEKETAARKAAEQAEDALKKALTAFATAETEDQLARKGIETAAVKLVDAQTAMDHARQAAAAADETRRRGTAGSSQVRAIAFSPDSRRLAIGTDAGKIHFWSADDGAPLDSLSSPAAPVATIAFSSTHTILCGTFARSLALLHTEPRWALVARLGTGDVRSPLRDRVNALAFSPDGRRLATGGGEPTRNGEILIWDLPSGRLLHSLTNVHSDAVFAVDFSPDGRQLASGAADKFARITDLDTGRVLRHLEGHTHHVLGVSWKLDGRTLATAGADNVVKLWNVPTGERKRNVTGYDKEITSVQFLHASDQFLTGSGDSRVRLFKDDGNEVRSFSGAPDFIQAAAASADGAIVIAGGQDSVLRVWNGTNGQSLVTFPPP